MNKLPLGALQCRAPKVQEKKNSQGLSALRCYPALLARHVAREMFGKSRMTVTHRCQTITAMAAHGRLVITGGLALNGCFSIVIVLLNKWIYTHYGFPNMTLTCIHFIFTTVGLLICQLAKVFQPKSLPILKMLPLSLTFCGFVVFTNLSLQTNSVGTYQLAKTMTTPCIILIQSYYYGREFSLPIKITLVSSLDFRLDLAALCGMPSM